MSDPNFASEERWLRGAIRAEEAALPVRRRPAELGRRWAVRRRWRIVRRLELGAAAVVIAAVGLGAIWSFAHQGQPLVIQPPMAPPQSMISPKEMVFVIDQTGSRHRQHAPGLGLVARFGLELADAHQVIQREKAHGVLRSTEEWAEPGRD